MSSEPSWSELSTSHSDSDRTGYNASTRPTNKGGGRDRMKGSQRDRLGGRSSAAVLFNFLFAVPLAFFAACRGGVRAASSFAGGAASTAGSVVQSMSGTMEFQMVSKLYRASGDLASGFAELGALGMALTLLLWVSGLFFGLAFCSVFITLACLYVLTCATGMNYLLNKVRKYLRDCFLLRVCAYTIPVVTVLKGLRFTTGVTVHFPEKSMVWILHVGHWVVRLCWRSCFEPRKLMSQGDYQNKPAQQQERDTSAAQTAAG